MNTSATAPGSRLRVVIIDRNDVPRRGVQAIAEDAGFDVVATSADPAEALALAREHEPAVVVLDPASAKNYVDVCAGLGALPSPPRILVLAQTIEPSEVYSYVFAGVKGCLVKDCSAADLTSAIRLVAEGQTVVAPQIAAALVADINHEARKAGNVGGLTEREMEVLGEVARGLSNRDIARELKVAENTVKNHVRNILDKLGLRSRVEATLYAIKNGLVDPK